LKYYLLIAAFITAISLSSCVTINTGGPGTTTNPPVTTTPPPAPSIPFEDRTWVLEKLGKQDAPQPALEGKEVTARFDPASGKVSGNAGCNSYSAAYQTNGARLTIAFVVSTKMACFPANVMQQESQYTTMLQGAQSYRVENNTLTILCSEERALVFRAK